jgi:hypothetical protein
MYLLDNVAKHSSSKVLYSIQFHVIWITGHKELGILFMARRFIIKCFAKDNKRMFSEVKVIYFNENNEKEDSHTILCAFFEL